MINDRAEKITLLREILAGKKSISDLCEEKIFIVQETGPEKYCDTDGKEWSKEEMELHKLKNKTHSFFCYSKFYFDNIGIHSKTGTLNF